MKHGKNATYVHHKCRCFACTAAHRIAQLHYNEQREARLLADPSLAPHGRHSTYANWRCRCDACTKAAAVVLAAQRARWRAS